MQKKKYSDQMNMSELVIDTRQSSDGQVKERRFLLKCSKTPE